MCKSFRGIRFVYIFRVWVVWRDSKGLYVGDRELFRWVRVLWERAVFVRFWRVERVGDVVRIEVLGCEMFFLGSGWGRASRVGRRESGGRIGERGFGDRGFGECRRRRVRLDLYG